MGQFYLLDSVFLKFLGLGLGKTKSFFTFYGYFFPNQAFWLGRLFIFFLMSLTVVTMAIVQSLLLKPPHSVGIEEGLEYFEGGEEHFDLQVLEGM